MPDPRWLRKARAKGQASVQAVRLERDLDVIELPAPPSTNNLFIHVSRWSRKQNKQIVRRVPSKDYEDWQKAVVGIVPRLRSPLTYPIGMELTLVGKWFRARDGANIEKPITDSLVAAGVLAGDSLLYITGQVWRYRPGTGEPLVRVRLIELARGLFDESL